MENSEFCALVGLMARYLEQHPKDGAERLREFFVRGDHLLSTDDVMVPRLRHPLVQTRAFTAHSREPPQIHPRAAHAGPAPVTDRRSIRPAEDPDQKDQKRRVTWIACSTGGITRSLQSRRKSRP